MRWFFFVLVVLGIVVAACWLGRAGIASHYIHKELNVPANIDSLEFSKGRADITHLWIGNIKGSKMHSSFTCEKIGILATMKQVFGNPLIIEEIDMEEAFIGVEIFNGNDNNWNHILSSTHKKGSRDYAIRKLVVKNLTVAVMQPDGSVKRYPTIPQMELTNITSESGFPVEEIEKAILKLMTNEALRKLGIPQLIDTFKGMVPGSPIKIFKPTS